MLLTTLLVAACCNGKSGSTTPTGTTTGTTGGSGAMADDVGPAADYSKLGVTCGDGDRCELGSCVTYYGIAGPNGPAFKSCEFTCAAGKGCPDGTTCITIADGPGAVCRPSEAPDRVEP